MPFAGYQDFDACVAANRGRVDDPEAYCASIEREVTKMSATMMLGPGLDLCVDCAGVFAHDGTLPCECPEAPVAKAAPTRGVMIGLFLPPRIQNELADLPVPDGMEPTEPGDMHVTLAYLGETDVLESWQFGVLMDVVRTTAEFSGPPSASLSGLGLFTPDDDGQVPVVGLVSSAALDSLRSEVVGRLDDRGVEFSRRHGFQPHVTLGRTRSGADVDFTGLWRSLETLGPVTFPTLTLAFGSMLRVDVPFAWEALIESPRTLQEALEDVGADEAQAIGLAKMAGDGDMEALGLVTETLTDEPGVHIHERDPRITPIDVTLDPEDGDVPRTVEVQLLSDPRPRTVTVGEGGLRVAGGAVRVRDREAEQLGLLKRIGAALGVVDVEDRASLEVETAVMKSADADRFTFGPLYIPSAGERLDAHRDFATADELQKAVWDYVRAGDRSIFLQHLPSVQAGEWVECATWPYEATVQLAVPGEVAKSRSVTLPANTPFLGVVWDEPAWSLVQKGYLRGYSFGGRARRIEVDLGMGELTKVAGFLPCPNCGSARAEGHGTGAVCADCRTRLTSVGRS